MKTIYKAETYRLRITRIEIESETNSFYTEVGSNTKSAKISNYHKFFNSKEEAVLFLQKYLQDKVLASERELNSNKRKLIEFNKKYFL